MADELFDAADIEAALRSQEVIDASIDLATRAANYWQGIALEHKDTGEYIESIGVVRNGDVVAVLCKSDIAAYLEYGTEDTPEFAFRARTEAHFNGGGA